MITIKDVEELVKGFGVHGRTMDAPLSGEEQRWANDIWAFFEDKNHYYAQSEHYRDEYEKMKDEALADAAHWKQQAQSLQSIVDKQRNALEKCADPIGGPLRMAPERIVAYVERLKEGEYDSTRLLHRARKAEAELERGLHVQALNEARKLLHSLRKMPDDKISPAIRVCIEGCLDRMEEFHLDTSPDGITRALVRSCQNAGISLEEGLRRIAEEPKDSSEKK